MGAGGAIGLVGITSATSSAFSLRAFDPGPDLVPGDDGWGKGREAEAEAGSGAGADCGAVGGLGFLAPSPRVGSARALLSVP